MENKRKYTNVHDDARYAAEFALANLNLIFWTTIWKRMEVDF